MWNRLKSFFTRIAHIFVWTDSPKIVEEDPVDVINVNEDGIFTSEDEDDDSYSLLANAIWTQGLQSLSLEELDQLAAAFWKEDEDVEIIDLLTAYDPEAGIHGHGTNTEEEMLQTLSDESLGGDEYA